MTAKRKRLLIGVGVCVCLILAVTAPLMWRAWKHGVKFERDFDGFSSAIISRDFQAAYDGADAAFKAATPYAEFLNIHERLAGRFGQLRAITHTQTIVEGKGDPMQWLASTDVTLRFDGGSAKLRYWFCESAGHWRLVGFRPIE